MKLRGFKTVAAGLAIAATAIFSNPEMQAFISEHIPWIGGSIGGIIIGLRALTSSSIFRSSGRPRLPTRKALGMLLAGALVLPLLGACGMAKQADTPLKKWAIAQEAHTAASDSLIAGIESGQVNKATAIRIDGWLDRAQSVLDLALNLISAGDDASALDAIVEAANIIDGIMEEIQDVTARNPGVIPWPHVSRLGPGRNGLFHYDNVGGLPGPRSDARGSDGDPDPRRRFQRAA